MDTIDQSNVELIQILNDDINLNIGEEWIQEISSFQKSVLNPQKKQIPVILTDIFSMETDKLEDIFSFLL